MRSPKALPAVVGGVPVGEGAGTASSKFVGESERLIRMIFKRARERAADGKPVIVFIDEMDSLLRTRDPACHRMWKPLLCRSFWLNLMAWKRLAMLWSSALRTVST